jgi:hypothetical protein
MKTSSRRLKPDSCQTLQHKPTALLQTHARFRLRQYTLDATMPVFAILAARVNTVRI